MRRSQNRTALIAGMLAIWLGSRGSAAPAPDTAVYTAASVEFQGLVAQARQDTDMPQLTNPKAAKLISTLSDTRTLSLRTYGMKDMSGLMDMCDRSNKAVMAYVMFDAKSIMNAQSDPQRLAARLAPLMEKNIRTFQNELQQLQPFLFRCVAKEIPLLTEFVQSLKPADFTAVRREGLKQARNGMFNVYYGALQASSDHAYAESYRTKILQTLAEITPQYASILPLQARRQIAGLATSNQPKASLLLHDDLQKIIAGMSDPRCEGLCAL